MLVYESFRPELEQIIQEEKLVDYMRQRFLINMLDRSDGSHSPKNAHPPLASRTALIDGEIVTEYEENPNEVLRYFSGKSGNKEGIYPKEIDGAARSLLRELKEDVELPKKW